MIKSRGYRIELGEIEAAIYAIPGVREAAVVAIPDDALGTRIRAFVVPMEPDSVSPLSVQQRCAERVPKYAVPEMVTCCESLPRTSTGKVDRPKLTRWAQEIGD
jgi:acyl-coenzyme A synthetase/AMP-(fatty) acid ligase